MTIFAVEHTTAQAIHRRPVLASEELRGLVPGEAVPGSSVRTLPVPPGREVFRLATLSDIHIGEAAFGVTRQMRDRRGLGPYPERCFTAALEELSAWGAQLLVLKGDLTEQGRAREWRTVASIVRDAGVPAVALAGNHDVWTGSADGRPLLGDAVELSYGVAVHDRPGVRIVLAHTAVPGRSGGRVRASVRTAAIAAIDGAAPGSASLLATHHQPHLRRWQHYRPAGIEPTESIATLDAIRETGRPTLWVAGHTHRHRRWVHRGVPVAETGSPKDFPGTWTGYVVHEGPAVRQVVRRIADPDVLAWTQRTSHAALGAWGRWAPGRLSDRCWVETFDAREPPFSGR